MPSFLRKKTLRHVLFWTIMLVYFMSVPWPYEKNKILLFESVFLKLVLQIILAYTILKVFIPRFLNTGKRGLFFSSCMVLIYILYIVYSSYKYFVMIPSYPEEFSYRPPFILKDRFTNFSAYIGSIPGYLFPTVILVIFNYYKKQQETAVLLEQKKTTELNALKNQLNPHFLFNTLNNLYALSLKKSEKTSEVIAKLSEILDYILYQCKDTFVPLKNELILLHNYIDLEEVRYGDRVKVRFTKQISEDAKIAPLLLLTFLENAYKHGVVEELHTAKIDVFVRVNSNEIEFKIENSKPAFTKNDNHTEREPIGLNNTINQLNLLYPGAYQLDVTNTKELYRVHLKVKTNGV